MFNNNLFSKIRRIADIVAAIVISLTPLSAFPEILPISSVANTNFHFPMGIGKEL